MTPIMPRAQFGVFHHIVVIPELRVHHVKVARLQHIPVYKTLVLSRMTAASPCPEIRIGAAFVVRYAVHWVRDKQTAVEFCRIPAVSIASQHISEQKIIPGNLITAVRFRPRPKRRSHIRRTAWIERNFRSDCSIRHGIYYNPF